MLKSEAGIDMVHIPYKGSAPAFTALMGGQVQFMAEMPRWADAVQRSGTKMD